MVKKVSCQDPGDLSRLTLVDVKLFADDVRRLELLQVALGLGFGQLIAIALDQAMPRFRSMVLVIRDAHELPEDFDLAGLGLGTRKPRRRDYVAEVKRLKKLGLSVPEWLQKEIS